MRLYLLALLSLIGGTALPALSAAPHAVSAPPTLDAAFNRLYNHDFEGSQRTLTQYMAANPDDPLGYAVRGAAYLYSELSRLQVLSKDHLTNNERIADTRSGKPDPQTRKAFMAATQEAQTRAAALLAQHPNDRNALLAMCIAAGVQRDYTALVEKRLRASLEHARESQSYAVRLLKVDPEAYDAYFTTGFSEYLLGSVPFFVRWFVKFEAVQGNKATGLRNLELVAQRGRYMKPFARMMLAMLYLRERKPVESERLLAELAHEFPENTIIRRELAKLLAQHGR